MKRFLSYLTTLFAVAFLAACGGGGGSSGISPNTPAFFTTAPATLTLTLGEAQSFVVGGGAGPYSVASGNTAVVLGVLNGNVLTLGGSRPGSATVTLRDALGATKSVEVTVAPAQALGTTAPSSLSLPIGSANAQVYQVVGGVGPYTASSSAPAIVSGVMTGNNLIVTGLVGGSAVLTIRDAVGSTLTVNVTVAPAEALSSSASPNVTVANNTTATYSVSGGTAPYTVSSSNGSVATATLSGSSLVITGRAPGTATITIRDAGGQTVTSQVNVVVPTAFYTTAPSAVTVAIGGNASFTVGGGVTPYQVSTSNQNVATATISNGTLTINGLAAGTATVLVRDSNGASITITVTVPSVQTVALFTTAPSAITLSVGASGAQTYSIGGGSGGYTIVSSNTSVVRVSGANDNPFTLTGVAPGSANVVVRDNAGNTVSIGVTVQNAAMKVNPDKATTIIGMVNYAYIIGGVGPYTAISGFPSAVTASIGTVNTTTGVFTPDTNGNVLRMVATQAVDPAQIVVTDSTGNSVNFALTANAGQPGFTFAPSTLQISENFNGDITLLLYGATGTTNIFSTAPSLIKVTATTPVTGNGSLPTAVTVRKTNVGVCSTGNVVITAVDATGATATSTITIVDNGDNAACP